MEDREESYRITLSSYERGTTVHTATLDDLVVPEESLGILFESTESQTQGLWWLNINCPTDEEVEIICKTFGVHSSLIEKTPTRERRDTLDVFESYYSARIQAFTKTSSLGYEPYDIHILVLHAGVVTFTSQASEAINHVRQQTESLEDHVSISSDWICYALVDRVIDSFVPTVEKTQNLTEAIENSLFIVREENQQAFLQQVGEARKDAQTLMNLLNGKADLLKRLAGMSHKARDSTSFKDLDLYLEDARDHVITMVASLSYFDTILSRAHSNYLAQLSVFRVAQDTRTTTRITKITFLTSIFVPVHMVTSMWGMNVLTPWTDDNSPNLHAFWGITAVMCCFLLVTIILGKRTRRL